MLSDLPDSTSANALGADAIAIERMAHTFALLSDPTRLRVLRTVLEYGEASVGGIAGAARISRFNASAHLIRLARGGLLRRRRVASTVYYQADDQKLRGICDSLLEVLRPRVRYRIGQGARYDVRKATCQGGGGLWAFLSHIREIKRGATLEVTTDDALAKSDIPAWTQKMGWKLARIPLGGAERFIAQRPI